MTRALMTLALVAMLVTVAAPNLSIAPANAAEKAAGQYCENLPESLAKEGFVPGICR